MWLLQLLTCLQLSRISVLGLWRIHIFCGKTAGNTRSGAALFQLIGAVVAMFAFGEGHHYGTVINAMSALCSAFTILFLFWTITHLVRRILNKEMDELTGNQIVGVLFQEL